MANEKKYLDPKEAIRLMLDGEELMCDEYSDTVNYPNKPVTATAAYDDKIGCFFIRKNNTYDYLKTFSFLHCQPEKFEVEE
jgi:hypothetical protein